MLDANPNTIVLFNAGSNVDMTLQQRAPALLYLWYPDRKAEAAQRLFEKVTPSGKCR